MRSREIKRQDLLYRDQEDPLGAHGLAGQSNSHSLCDESRDPWHGTQRVLKAEGGCGHCLLSDFCFLPTINHRTCALQSKAILPPPAPKPLTPFYERPPDTLSWRCFWVSDMRPTCSPFLPLFTLTINSHAVSSLPVPILFRLLCPFRSWSKWSLNSRVLQILLFLFTDSKLSWFRQHALGHNISQLGRRFLSIDDEELICAILIEHV